MWSAGLVKKHASSKSEVFELIRYPPAAPRETVHILIGDTRPEWLSARPADRGEPARREQDGGRFRNDHHRVSHCGLCLPVVLGQDSCCVWQRLCCGCGACQRGTTSESSGAAACTPSHRRWVMFRDSAEPGRRCAVPPAWAGICSESCRTIGDLLGQSAFINRQSAMPDPAAVCCGCRLSVVGWPLRLMRSSTLGCVSKFSINVTLSPKSVPFCAIL
jgi:hypothetical protein